MVKYNHVDGDMFSEHTEKLYCLVCKLFNSNNSLSNVLIQTLTTGKSLTKKLKNTNKEQIIINQCCVS